MFLSTDELRKLTGRVRNSAQLRWLCANGFAALQDADGRPLVLKSAVEARMGAPMSKSVDRRKEPDWGALNAATKAS